MPFERDPKIWIPAAPGLLTDLEKYCGPSQSQKHRLSLGGKMNFGSIPDIVLSFKMKTKVPS
jgi:hypothetical protein